jgi:hypothetical protein
MQNDPNEIDQFDAQQEAILFPDIDTCDQEGDFDSPTDIQLDND